jgi:hypothetical protein
MMMSSGLESKADTASVLRVCSNSNKGVEVDWRNARKANVRRQLSFSSSINSVSSILLCKALPINSSLNVAGLCNLKIFTKGLRAAY